MDKKKIDYILLALLIFIFILLFYTVYKLTTEGGKCSLNPLGYSVQQLEKNTENELLCSCSIPSKGSYNPTIYFNRNGVINITLYP